MMKPIKWIKLRTFELILIFFSINSYCSSNISELNNDSDVNNLHNECGFYSKDNVSANVASFIESLFSQNIPSIGDALKFSGKESGSESFLEKEHELEINKCLNKWHIKDWGNLSDKQIEACGDFDNNTQESLVYKKIRNITGLINNYKIEKIKTTNIENVQGYQIVLSYKSKSHVNKSYITLFHRLKKCEVETNLLEITSIKINGKKLDFN